MTIPCNCCPVDEGCSVSTSEPLYGCRLPDGTVHWYDADGDEHPAADVRTGCCIPGECWTPKAPTDYSASPFRLWPLDGAAHDFLTLAPGQVVPLRVPNISDPGQCDAPRVWGTVQRVSSSIATAANIAGAGNGGMQFVGGNANVLMQMDFWQPVDLRLALSSYQCAPQPLERFQFVTPGDEFIAGPGSSLPSLVAPGAAYPANTAFCNGNNISPSFAIFRNVTTVQWRQLPNAGIVSITAGELLRAVDGWNNVPCV